MIQTGFYYNVLKSVKLGGFLEQQIQISAIRRMFRKFFSPVLALTQISKFFASISAFLKEVV